MQDNYHEQFAEGKPGILDIIGERVDLRKAGREFVGRCPFHDDRHPSLYVNPAKGVFLCRACQESGDVIDFIMLIDGITFPQAVRALGIERGNRPAPRLRASRKRAAELAAAWMAEQRRKVGVLLAEVLEKIELVDEIDDSKLGESFIREQSFLRDLYEDLDMSCNAADLLSIRPMIEVLTEGIEPPAIHFDCPELTPQYRARLKTLARGNG